MKKCTVCKIHKDVENYNKDASRQDGLEAKCRNCKKSYCKKYIQLNRAKIQKISENWYKKNKERALNNSKQYYLNNREKVKKRHAKYEKDKAKNNVNFRLARNLRSRLRSAIKSNQKTGSAIGDLGCSIEFLKSRLESLFVPGMSWDNYGYGKEKWNIDHIFPLAKLDLTKQEEFRKACHYTNLQPLWHEKNKEKRDKV